MVTEWLTTWHLFTWPINSKFLWNMKVHRSSHKRQPLNPILKHLNPDHTLTHYTSKIYCNVIPLSTPKSLKLSFRLSLFNQNYVSMYYIWPPYPTPWFNDPESSSWKEQIMKTVSMYLPLLNVFLLVVSVSPQDFVLKHLYYDPKYVIYIPTTTTTTTFNHQAKWLVVPLFAYWILSLTAFRLMQFKCPERTQHMGL
jgi:hypothetical protein